MKYKNAFTKYLCLLLGTKEAGDKGSERIAYQCWVPFCRSIVGRCFAVHRSPLCVRKEKPRENVEIHLTRASNQ